ncbi:NucA/NucB deoxyribonuclease domain-containing protein [Streptomyces justiciae]|uniref:NucA/NucB deoxyribonuclease domain-containing protein n=1 Tax=Streptomyces justiciae TaxID=2780140 RepID=UPI0021190BC3|nr:NucA/NucB deoxyribonuclease domain-containing protein [Streptomyces justiciae]MCW8382427.1 NucA/NucB deoxyribonuclease domain-containing protein [Streptomyces justiciae]
MSPTFKQRLLGATIALAAVLSVISAAPAAAAETSPRPAPPDERTAGTDSAADSSTATMNVYLTSDQWEKLRSTPRSSKIQEPPPQVPGQRPGPDAWAEAEDRTTPLPVSDTPPDGAVKDCLAWETVLWHVYDRFTACQRYAVEAKYYEISNTAPPELEGTTTFTFELLAQADARQRRVRTFVRLVKDSVDYDWGAWDNVFLAPNINLTVSTDCTSGQRLEVCTTSPGPVTMPFAVWDNNDRWYYWDVFNEEKSGQGRDRVSAAQWHLEFSSRGGQYEITHPYHTPDRMIRCDSAGYFSKGQARYPHACVFADAVPHLDYQLGGPRDEVAEHIWTAQELPASTYPLPQPGGTKTIPGQYTFDQSVPGLHRILETHPQYAENREHKTGACYKTGRYRHLYQDTGLPTPPDTKNPDPSKRQDCDEYPFASTLEGCASQRWDCSVKAVNASVNRGAGTDLKNFYVDQRILARDDTLFEPELTNDTFYVDITSAPTPARLHAQPDHG